MKKITTLLIALILAMSIVSSSSVFADEVTPTPTMATEEVQIEEPTPETESSEETEPTIVLSEEATAFIQNVNDAENNKENILNAAQEYVDAYVASFDAEGEEATAAADALIAEKEEAFFNLFDQGALLDAYDALSEEEKDNEEVINAKAILDALVLGIDTIMNTEEPTDEPVVYSTGVVVNVGSPTTIDISLISGSVVIKSDGLWVNGVKEPGETTVNPDGYEFTGTYVGTPGTTDQGTNRNITVEPGVTATIILNNFNLEINSYLGKRNSTDFIHALDGIDASHSDTTIILKGNNRIFIHNTSDQNVPGVYGSNCINVNGADTNLTIKAFTDNTDTLTIGGPAGDLHISGISSNFGQGYKAPSRTIEASGTINIESGHIIANASMHTPAIGNNCMNNNEPGDINISGGIVEAVGGTYSAAIGGGAQSKVGDINISGGAQVIARGGTYATAIGNAGYTAAQNTNASVGNINISGGETHVWAYGDAATNQPGIGASQRTPNGIWQSIASLNANPEVPDWATYIKYGTSATDYAYTTTVDNNGAGESLATPISADREFATFLKSKREEGINVFYTEVYFGLPHDEFANTDKADIGANNYSTCAGSFNWADTTAAKTQLLSLAKVSGHDQDGNLLSETDILNNIAANATAQATFNNQIQAIFDANANNATGNYLLTFEFNYVDNNDHTNKTMKVSTHIQFRDACSPTQGGNNPTIAASNAVHPTGGAAFTKAQLIGLTEGTASNYLGLDADLINDITLTQADVDKINAAKTSNKTGIFPLTYTYVTTTDGTAPVTLTKTVYVTLTDTGTPFTPKDPNHPEKGQNMGPQFGANDYITKTGGAAFDTTTLKKMQNVSAKDSNGTSVPLDKLIPDPTQLAAINAAKTSGQVGDFPLKYTFEDTDGTIREVETTVSLRDNEGTPPSPVEKKDENNKVIGYVISTPELGSNNHTTPTGGTGWTEDEIKDLLDVIGKDENGVEIPRTDFTVDATQLATLNAEKLAGKCGRYPITFTAPTGETSISYVTLNGCVVPKPPVNPGPWLVTYVDCKGNTVKVEWVGDGYNSTKPNGNYSDVNNVHFHYTAYPNNCGVYRVPNTGVKDYSWIYYALGGIALFGAMFLINKAKKKAN